MSAPPPPSPPAPPAREDAAAAAVGSAEASIHSSPLGSAPLPRAAEPLSAGAEPQTPAGEPPALQILAMHGWAGDGQGWEALRPQICAPGWSWRSGERGYGGRSPGWPAWAPGGRRLLIAHSMGPHLLPPGLLAQAEAVVLLASFARFVPPGREGRRVAHALAAMGAQLADPPVGAEAAADAAEHEAASRAQGLLQTFLAEAAAPQPAALLPPGPASAPVGPRGRRLLRDDLERLAACRDLPVAFPDGVPVLIVEAGADRIVAPEARELLRRRLPDAEVLHCEGAGHCLLGVPLAQLLRRWIQRMLLS